VVGKAGKRIPVDRSIVLARRVCGGEWVAWKTGLSYLNMIVIKRDDEVPCVS